jgi:hypothetical protein
MHSASDVLRDGVCVMQREHWDDLGLLLGLIAGVAVGAWIGRSGMVLLSAIVLCGVGGVLADFLYVRTERWRHHH